MKDVTAETITFEELIEFKKQFLENAKTVFFEERDGKRSTWGIPKYRKSLYIEGLYKEGLLTKDTYKNKLLWATKQFLDYHWNSSPLGRNYKSLRAEYETISKDPAMLERLKKVAASFSCWVPANLRYVIEAVDNNKFVSFWVWHKAYDDTRGQFRHWWDTFAHDPKYKVGDVLTLRSTASGNHVFKIFYSQHDRPKSWLRCVGASGFKTIKSKTYMVLAYDQKIPTKTFSYKKSAGSHRLLTVLPIGSKEIYYIPEQFLKKRRKGTKK